MTYKPITAKIKEHKVELPQDWPDGMEVTIQPSEEAKRPSVWDVLKKWEGVITDAPTDLAENLDHYVHGLPKKDASPVRLCILLRGTIKSPRPTP